MDDSIKSTYTGTVPVFPPSEQNLVPVGSVEMPENPPDLECEESRDSVRDDSYSSRFWQKAIGGMLFHCCPLNFGVFWNTERKRKERINPMIRTPTLPYRWKEIHKKSNLRRLWLTGLVWWCGSVRKRGYRFRRCSQSCGSRKNKKIKTRTVGWDGHFMNGLLSVRKGDGYVGSTTVRNKLSETKPVLAS